MSHSLNWTGLCESLESVLPNHHGNSVRAHCHLTTNVEGSSEDITAHSERSWLLALSCSCSDASRELQICCYVSGAGSQATSASSIMTRQLVLWWVGCVSGIKACESRQRMFPASVTWFELMILEIRDSQVILKTWDESQFIHLYTSAGEYNCLMQQSAFWSL